jgi:hypothetical protein
VFDVTWQKGAGDGQVIVGAVKSLVHVAVRDVVDVFPQASIAVNVLVCDRSQPVVAILPLVKVTVAGLHASVADAVPNAASITEADGLHPSDKLFPVAVTVGAVLSSVQVAVRAAVDVLPQASIAVNVLVCERLQPVLAMPPSINVTVGGLHASVAVAVPRAPSIAAGAGLHPSVKLFPVAVMVGAVLSSVHVAVRAAVDVLPHSSIAVNVLV